jgi:hypothetical protein
MRGEDRDPAAFQTTTAVEPAHLAVTVTMFPSRVELVGFEAQDVVASHLAVPVTMFDPTLGYIVNVGLLEVPVTFHEPTVVVREHLAIVGAHLVVSVHLHPPSIVSPDAYFMTPIELVERVPRWERLEWVASEHLTTGVPHSPRYRQFLRTQVGTEITIDGIVYGGGRWHGPLSTEQIIAITAAGYADRIVMASEPGLLPAGID